MTIESWARAPRTWDSHNHNALGLASWLHVLAVPQWPRGQKRQGRQRRDVCPNVAFAPENRPASLGSGWLYPAGPAMSEAERVPVRALSVRESSWRRLLWTLSLSAGVHVVLTPVAGLIAVFAFLFKPVEPDDTSEAEQLRSIPITFLGEWEPPLEEPEPAAPVPPSTAQVALSEPKPPTPAAPPAPKAPVAPKPALPAPATPAAAPKAEPSRRTGAEIGHPVELAGLQSNVIDENANVNLLLVTERLRGHPLGERIGPLLVAFPQWSSFFASGEIDPVRDLNRILIVGPQFRRTADVVAILQHGLPEPILVRAIDKLVARPPRGRWLRGKVKAARAHADRAERIFALTAPEILVVAPPALEASLLANPPRAFPAPEGDEAVVLHVKTPWRALIGLPFQLPESIEWLRLDVTTLEGGAARVRLTARDADAEQAARHADALTIAINTLTNPDLGALGALMGLRSIAFIDKFQLRAAGQQISGEVDVSPRQLERLLVYAEELVRSWTGRRDVKAPPSGPAQPPNRVPAPLPGPRPAAPRPARPPPERPSP